MYGGVGSMGGVSRVGGSFAPVPPPKMAGGAGGTAEVYTIPDDEEEEQQKVNLFKNRKAYGLLATYLSIDNFFIMERTRIRRFFTLFSH